jgi:uncharacterized membrane protein YcjF (UPF0283 family)
MNGIRWKIIVAIMVVIAGVCTIFTNWLILYSQTKLEEKITAKEEASRLLTKAVMEQVRTMNRARIYPLLSGNQKRNPGTQSSCPTC